MELDRQYFELFGKHHHKIDDGGRIALPAGFRKSFPDSLKEFVITLSEAGECLYVFDKFGFNEWVNQAFIDKFGGYNSSDPTHRKLRRRLTSQAASVMLDASGRIMVPQEMREAVGIGKEALVVGTTGRFEIWDEARFDEDDDADLSLLFG